MERFIGKDKAIAVIEEKQKALCPAGKYGRKYVSGSDREKFDAWEEILDEIENIPETIVQNDQGWIPLSVRMPLLGACIIATIKNNLEGGKRELRYPVYYMQKVYGDGYAFYHGDTANILLPEYSEVIAWRYLPVPYEGE